MSDENLVRYYSARAAEFDRIYELPERQRDLAVLRRRVRELVAGERVLELACGTGYWTAVMADAAETIRAVDLSEESIEIARGKGLPPGRVSFELGDAFDLDIEPSRQSMVVTGFLWSHVPVQQLDPFLKHLASTVAPGTRLVFFDNRFVEGSSTPASHMDEHGNHCQFRRVSTGEEFTVIKNFPFRDELLERARPHSEDAIVELLEYYWLLQFTAAGQDSS
jgi:ubiquinone/menaquinone biosynthesis C-methylase UbiE